jgi:hypothetical protein
MNSGNTFPKREFKKEMAEEFVDRATIFCLKETKNLLDGKSGLDSSKWSWEKK